LHRRQFADFEARGALLQNLTFSAVFAQMPRYIPESLLTRFSSICKTRITPDSG
jgi:hypothetical protein